MEVIAITLFAILMMLGLGCLVISCWAIGLAMADIITDIIRNTSHF